MRCKWASQASGEASGEASSEASGPPEGSSQANSGEASPKENRVEISCQATGEATISEDLRACRIV